MKSLLIFIALFLPFFLAFNAWRPFMAYRMAKISQVPVGFGKLMAMRLRGVDPVHVVEAYVMAAIMGGGDPERLGVNIDKLAQHRKAGGSAVKVMQAVIASSQAKLVLSFDDLCSMELSGEDPLEYVAQSVKDR